MSFFSFLSRRRAMAGLSAMDASERLKAVDALAELGGDEDRLALESALRNHAYPQVQEAAARALGRLAHPASADALRRVLAPGFFPPSRGSGIDVGDQDAFQQRRIRRAAEDALTRLGSP